MQTLITSLTAFLATYLMTPFIRKIAFRYRIVDIPGGRKVHEQATPLLGGLAIYIGFLLAWLINASYLSFFLPVLLGATIIFALGLIDDIRKLSALTRLICQAAVGVFLILVQPHLRVSFLPQNVPGYLMECIVTLLWIIGLTNAYNYLDGLDGLAAGSAIINLSCFTIILAITGQYSLSVLAVIMIFVCLAFLPHNLRKNGKIFMGDAGSTFLGFILACLALLGNWAEDNVVKIFIPVLILGVPIFDMIFTTVMRIKEEKIRTLIDWLRYGGRDHFHHYLVDIGFKPAGAVTFIYLVTLSLGLNALMVSNDRAFEIVLSLLNACIIFSIIATLIVIGKRRRSGWSEKG